jgi:hypothetical protein
MTIARLLRAHSLGIALLAVVAAGSAMPAATEPPPSRSAIAWLIFVDDLHVDFRNTGRLRSLIDAMVSALVADGDYVGAVSSGPSSIELDPSLDRARLQALTRKATGSALASTDIARLVRDASPSSELHYRAVVSLATASDAVRRLAEVTPMGRAVVYISNGYGVEALQSPAVPQGGGAASGSSGRMTSDDVRQHLARLVAGARASGVTIFAVDARRLRGENSDPVDMSPEGLRYRANARASLRAISDGTGGFAILEEQALADSLANISRAMRP